MADEPQSKYGGVALPKSKYGGENVDPRRLENLVVNPKDEPQTSLDDASGQFISNPEPAAPYIGRFAANSAPAVGATVGGVPGTMFGTGIAQLLKASFPKLFGQPTDNVPLEGVKDIALNNLIPGAIGKGVGVLEKGIVPAVASGMAKNFPGVRQGAAQEMTSQIMQKFAQPESQILEQGAADAGQTYNKLRTNIAQNQIAAGNPTNANTHPAVQQAMDDMTNTFGKNKVGQKLLKLQKDLQAGVDVAGSQEYKDIANTALKDLVHVRNWKLVAGADGVQNLALNKVMSAGGQAGTFDASKMLAELSGPSKEIYEEAIDPTVMSNFKDLINEIHSQQAGHTVSDAVIKSSKNKLIWATSLAGGMHSFLGVPGMAAGGVTLTNQFLAHAMENPQTAKLVVEAMRTPALSPKGQLISNMLGNLWRAGADVGTVPEK